MWRKAGVKSHELARNPSEQPKRATLSSVALLHCIGQTYPTSTAPKSFALEAGVKPRKKAHPEEVALAAAGELQVDVLVFLNRPLDRDLVRACDTAPNLGQDDQRGQLSRPAACMCRVRRCALPARRQRCF